MNAFGGNLAGGVAWELLLEREVSAGSPGKIFEYVDDVPAKLNPAVLQVAKLIVKADGASRSHCLGRH